jgi:hypothetical protein
MTAMFVRCWGHVDPVKGYYRKSYYLVHKIDQARAIQLLESMSRDDWEDGPRCLEELDLSR